MQPHDLFTIFAKSRAECTNGFLGLKPWYEYLELTSGCDIKNFKLFPPDSSVPLILLAVVDDLLRIAGLVAVGFIIVGAIGFIASQGNPEDTAKAQSTVINALLGLAAAVVSVAFVSCLGYRLGQ